MCQASGRAICESEAMRYPNIFCFVFVGSENIIKAMPTAPMIQEKNGVVNVHSHQRVGTTTDFPEVGKSE